MDIFGFASWCLTIIAIVTLLVPLNVPLMALAYKIRQGGAKIDMESGEFWWRTLFASLGLAGATLVMLGLAFSFVNLLELRAGLIHLPLFMVYLPAAAFLVFWIYALDDLFQGLSVFALYVLLPTVPVVLAGRFFKLWPWLRDNAPWLLPPT